MRDESIFGIIIFLVCLTCLLGVMWCGFDILTEVAHIQHTNN